MEEHIPDNPHQVALRPAQADDEPFLLDVYAGTRADELAAWGWDAAQQLAFLRMQFTVQRRAYEMQYGEASHDIILFKDKEAGRIMVNRTEQEILLVDIALLPQYRNYGIGSSLIKDLCAEAASKDLPVRLQVLKSNTAAARLYERLGFSMTGDSGIHFEMEWCPHRP